VRLLTEVRGVVVLRTVETHRRQVGHSVETGSLVDALPFGHDVDVVEHLVESGAGLVDRADDGSSASCQLFQNADALSRRRTVQARGRLVQKHDGWIVDQFEGDREALLLSSGQPLTPCVLGHLQTESFQNVVDLKRASSTLGRERSSFRGKIKSKVKLFRSN
jgi:hypothetical protein